MSMVSIMQSVIMSPQELCSNLSLFFTPVALGFDTVYERKVSVASVQSAVEQHNGSASLESLHLLETFNNGS